MTQLLNSAEGGSNGTTVTTGNSGGTSGNAFDSVLIGTGASVTYSSAQSAHGELSIESVLGSSASSSMVEWSTSLTGSSLSQVWFRVYVYLPALPTGNLRLFRCHNGGTFLGAVAINSSGNISLLDSGKRVLAVDPFYFGESGLGKRAYLFGLLVSAVGERPLGIQTAQLSAICRWWSRCGPESRT